MSGFSMCGEVHRA